MAITVNLDRETARDELPEALTALRALGNTPRKSGDGWMAKCPAHKDGKHSLSLTEGRDGRLVMHCHAGCEFGAVKAKLGIPDRRPPGSTRNEPVPPTTERRIVDTYPYHDARGELLYEVLRYEPKDFRQRRPDGKGGHTWSLGDVERVLFDLPGVLAAVEIADRPIYLVEGEKDAIRIIREGGSATTLAGGAAYTKKRAETLEILRPLTGCPLVSIITDNDDAGRAHAQRLYAALTELGILAEILEPALDTPKADVTDHLNAGRTLAELRTVDIIAEPNSTEPDEPEPNFEIPSLGWTPLDLVTLGDTPRIPPELGSLIYIGRRHLVSGESESGKSWLGFGIAADELLAGHGVVWVDLDYMGAQDILERLRQFGVPDATIRERFAFYQPEGPLAGASLAALLSLIQAKRARIVIIDAFTGFCALHGLKSKEGDEVEQAYRLMQPLCDANAAVFVIDHVVKDRASRGAYSAGSERKHSGADIHLGFTLIDTYGRGKTGRARITVHKDRPAQLARPTAGIFKLVSDPSTHMVKWSLEEDHSTADDGTWSPTGLMESISRYLEAQAHPASLTDIKAHVSGKDTYKATACERLARDGYAIETQGARAARLFASLKPYREGEE